MSNHREMFGDEYRLTIIEKDGDAPPMTERMFRMILDELGVRGSFNFKANGHLPQSPSDARPKMSAMLAGNAILVSMRWGTGEGDSVSGSLFVPNGNIPAVVHKHMVDLLGTLNAEGWPDLKLNGSGQSPEPSPFQPIKVAPAASPAVSSPVPASTALAVIDEGLALELFKKASANATVKGSRIHDYLHRHHPEPGNRHLVSEVVARLEEKGIFRRVSVDAGNSEWQFTEPFLEKHGLTVEDYIALPKVVIGKRGGNHRPAAPSPEAMQVLSAHMAASAPASIHVEPKQPDMAKIDVLCDELENLNAERSKAATALADIDEKMASKEVEIARAMQDVLKRLGYEEAP